MYIYIYIHRSAERESERETETDREREREREREVVHMVADLYMLSVMLFGGSRGKFEDAPDVNCE